MTDFDSIEKMLTTSSFEVKAYPLEENTLRKVSPYILVSNIYTGEDLRISFTKEGKLFSFYYDDKNIKRMRGLFKGE